MLQVNNIAKNFSGRMLFYNVSFCVPDAKIYGLVADNGVGKTTLLRIIANIYDTDEGTVVASANVSYLPEERGVPLDYKVFDFLCYIAQLKGLSKKMAKSCVGDLLKKYSLFGFANYYIGNLSKGMQQKIQFLSVVLNKPKVLVLDEPFSGVDEKNKDLFLQELTDLKNMGASILLSAHKMEELTDFCDAFLLLNEKGVDVIGFYEIKNSEK